MIGLAVPPPPELEELLELDEELLLELEEELCELDEELLLELEEELCEFDEELLLELEECEWDELLELADCEEQLLGFKQPRFGGVLPLCNCAAADCVAPLKLKPPEDTGVWLQAASATATPHSSIGLRIRIT